MKQLNPFGCQNGTKPIYMSTEEGRDRPKIHYIRKSQIENPLTNNNKSSEKHNSIRVMALAEGREPSIHHR